MRPLTTAPPAPAPYPKRVRGLSGVNAEEIRLDQGSHTTYEDGHCLLEVAAHLAGEPHTDRPACVCPVLAAAGRGLNDALGDKRRQALLGGLAPALVGTRDPSKERQRSLEWLDWLVRVYLPTWLDLVPALASHASAIRGLPAGSEENAATTRKAVYAARAAAEVAAASAARNIARGGTDAVWRVAVAVQDAARSAVRGVSHAELDMVWAGVWTAARGAATTQLTPTVEALQDSAADLLRHQCGLRTSCEDEAL